jgi:uncharacterized delta-60 repeat protein
VKTLILTLTFIILSIAVSGQNAGTLDLSYGDFGSGFAITEISPNHYSQTNGIAIQQDGKCVLVGHTNYAGEYKDMVLVRYDADGSLDLSFGNNGIVIVGVSGISEYGNAIQIQSDGKIVVAGHNYSLYGPTDERVWRFNEDGTPDVTFGNAGSVTTDIGNMDNIAEACVIQPDGKIITGGYAGDRFVVVRYNSNGTLDYSFGTNGFAILGMEYYMSFVKAIDLQNDGKIVVAGMSFEGNCPIFTIARFTENGELDVSFGGVGVVKIDVGGGNDYSTKLKILKNGKILVGGHTWIANEPFLKYDVAIVQLDEDGNLDNSFGNNGIVKTNIIDGENYCKGFTIQPDGKIVVAGEYVDYRTYNIFAVRYLEDGTVDDSFGNNGIAIFDIYGQDDQASGVVLQQDGKIVISGSTSPDMDNIHFFAVRLHNDLNTNTNLDFVDNINIYPNPASDIIYIDTDKITIVGNVQIADLNGKVLYDKPYSNNCINVSFLPKGTYILSVATSNGVKYSKFLKQ